ncbi:MAG: SufD family Fe-S cluster assembly protein [Mycoplasma sp.]
MQNNFFLINESREFEIKENQIISMLELSNSDLELELIFNIYSNVNLEVNFSSINLNHKKNINFKFNLLGENIKCISQSNCLALNKSTTELHIDGIGFDQTLKGAVSININGIIDSSTSTIIGVPKFIFVNNEVDAHHSLVIGSINEEELFYLMSRGINQKDAKYLLSTSKLFDCLKTLEENDKNIYKEKILEMWGNNA